MGLGFEPKRGLKEPIYQVTAHVAVGERGGGGRPTKLRVCRRQRKTQLQIFAGAINSAGTGFPRCRFGAWQIKLPVIHGANGCGIPSSQ